MPLSGDQDARGAGCAGGRRNEGAFDGGAPAAFDLGTAGQSLDSTLDSACPVGTPEARGERQKPDLDELRGKYRSRRLLAADRLEPGSPVAGQAYFINEPQPVPLWNWVNRLLALAGLSAVERSVSARVAYSAGACLEAAYRCLRRPEEPPMTRFLASQLSTSHYYSVSKAERDFGFRSTVSVEEGMQRMRPELERLVRDSA